MQDQVVAIADLSRANLIEQWVSAYGHSPPKGLSRRLLEYVAAYNLQSKAVGGLKPAARRKLRQLMRSDQAGESLISRATSQRLPAGSRLVREWRGQTHTVDVLEKGFAFEGQHYSSLSRVARAITGARWSGPRFFGL